MNGQGEWRQTRSRGHHQGSEEARVWGVVCPLRLDLPWEAQVCSEVPCAELTMDLQHGEEGPDLRGTCIASLWKHGWDREQEPLGI